MERSKINIYVGANAEGTVRQKAVTAGAAAIREAMYRQALASAVAIYDGYRDRLIADGGSSENNLVLRTGDGSEIEFIDARIDVTRANDIKPTALINRAGMVKERIQAKDYTVVITGNLMGDRGRFPYDALKLLNDMLNTADSIEAASAYLSIFGIERLALKNAEFLQGNLAYFNVMPFKLAFDSDMDYDFLVKEE
jgi:hypothetical protein